MKKVVFNWSGGKDSSLCLYKVLQGKQYEVTTLLTSVSEYQRISMHGVRVELLKQQADAIGLPLDILQLPEMPDMQIYEEVLTNKLTKWEAGGVNSHVFGDIFLEDLKAYRENQLAKVNCEAVFPLWKQDTKELVKEFVALGFKAVIVCCNNRLLGQEWVGRVIDENFINELPDEVDLCGENGEFHSFVYDGPIFKKPVNFTIGEKVLKDYNNETAESQFWYVDLVS